MSWSHRTIIVPAAYAPLARSLAEGVAPGDSGKGMWATELEAKASPGTITHYISSGGIKPEFAALLEDAQGIYDAAGGQVPLATIQALLAAATITPDLSPSQVHELIDSMGLQMKRGEL